MPLELVPVHILRPKRTRTSTAGKTVTEMAVPGSPFLARVYRIAQTTVQRDEAQAGVATVDAMQRLSIPDPACPVQTGDIALLPLPNGATQRAKILRPRYYADRVQYDLETGAEQPTSAGKD